MPGMERVKVEAVRLPGGPGQAGELYLDDWTSDLA